MNAIALLVLSFGMSMDAFAASLAKGSGVRAMRFGDALKIGLIFGVIEALTPLVGYFIGAVARSWIGDFDHWLSFALLCGLGLHVIIGRFLANVPPTARQKAAGRRRF